MDNDVSSSERFLSLEQVLWGDFEGGPTVSRSPSGRDAISPIFEGDVPPLKAGARGSGVASGKVVSHWWSDAVDSAHEEDVSGSSISRRLRQKCNIDPLFSQSPVVIDIADTDDPQPVETVDLHWPDELGIVGNYSVPLSVLGDAP
ncbi:unnamed protein product [Lactuca virosa]|uniref:Uncharacterized protein n=1 Tax=Lactuca virosa TaxID=75947 RepID=A0AAU9NRV0_9ASTR|nr:unnamed protein product [Lactuca virosa]